MKIKFRFFYFLLLANSLLLSCQVSSQTKEDGTSSPDQATVDSAYNKALSVNTIESYTNFLNSFPQSNYVNEITTKRASLDTVKKDPTFKKLQLNNENPKTAYADKENTVIKLLADKNIDYNTLEIFMRVIKEEQILEMWAKDRVGNNKFVLIKTYNLCVEKNPDKLRNTDLLVPESFYYIAKFHPANPYFLRMEVNFPNESDKKRGRSGGDIAIHGGCFSTYCTPFTDSDIKEIYIFAVEAKSKGQEKVPVHNFPFRMTDENMKKYMANPKYSSDAKRIFNWENMKYGFEYFEKNKTLFDYTVDEKGKYIYKN